MACAESSVTLSKLSSVTQEPRLAWRYNYTMNDRDFLREALQRLCDREGGYKAVADKAKVSPDNLWQVLNGILLPSGNPRSVGPSVREKISKAYPSWLNISAQENAPPYVQIPPIDLEENPEYPAIRRVNFKLSAGANGFGIEYIDSDGPPIVFQKSWFVSRRFSPAKLFATKVANGSMEPGLYDGDTVVVNTESITPKDGVVFAANFEGELVIKRLVRDAGQWWLSSDNPDQRRYARKLCDDNVHLIGEIVHKQSERI